MLSQIEAVARVRGTLTSVEESVYEKRMINKWGALGFLSQKWHQMNGGSKVREVSYDTKPQKMNGYSKRESNAT